MIYRQKKRGKSKLIMDDGEIKSVLSNRTEYSSEFHGLQSRGVQERYGCLYSRYEANSCYYELVSILRRLAFVFISVTVVNSASKLLLSQVPSSFFFNISERR